MSSLACARPAPPGELLAEVTAAWGLPPAPEWADGRYQMSEIPASGVGLFDAEEDGDLDIFLVCHQRPDQQGTAAPDRLFRQEDVGRFTEVGGAAGLADPGYGNAVTVGDVDNDGDLDVYVGNLGADTLYLGRGDGTYEDRTREKGIVEGSWTAAAAFLDHDRDGDLDLFVVHYLVDDPTRVCQADRTAKQDYCGPSRYQSVPDQFFRNDGASFRDVTRESGIVEASPGLGIFVADVSDDGWPDVYVANDLQANQLWINQRNGTFADQALARGVALSGMGQAEASMGVTLGDINEDGSLDVFVTNLVNETSTLYLSAPGGVYRDRSAATGLGAATLASTSWGCGFVDLDHDADLDLPIVNGRIGRGTPDPRARLSSFWNDYAQCNQLFLGDGNGRFVEATSLAGAFGSDPDNGRALALGDLDGDGDVDMVTSTLSDRLRVWRNDAPRGGTHWLRVRALTQGRDALGAQVRIEAGGQVQTRVVATTYSYAATNEPAVHFGLGTEDEVDLLEVRWPSGTVERFQVPRVDRLLTIREGESGTPASR